MGSYDERGDELLLRELESLRRENLDLKALATRLTQAASRSHDRELSWVYAMEGNRDGVWDWNVVTGEVYFSTRWKEMLGFAEDEISNNLAEWESRVHPDDIEAVRADLGKHLRGEVPFYQNEHRVRCKDGSYKWILDRGKIFSWTENGEPLRVVGTHTDVTDRKQAEHEKERLIVELQEANSRIKVLSGLLPICSSCKKIRDAGDQWLPLERYIHEHSEAQFSHGICPDCLKKLYPEFADGRT